jgi:hypothetical protein
MKQLMYTLFTANCKILSLCCGLRQKIKLLMYVFPRNAVQGVPAFLMLDGFCNHNFKNEANFGLAAVKNLLGNAIY